MICAGNLQVGACERWVCRGRVKCTLNYLHYYHYVVTGRGLSAIRMLLYSLQNNNALPR